MNLPIHADFTVIDESADWLVVDKPAPLIVHPANRQDEPTLLDGVRELLRYDIANGARPAIVNRLDRDTSGIVVVAKTTAAARELGGILERREARKEYLAIVHGHPPDDQWQCDAPLRRAGEIHPSSIWVRQIVDPEGRPCHTRFTVERRFRRDDAGFSLVRCFPVTGRMHQIRVHLAHAGHPIVGDKIYAGDGSEYLEWMDDGWSDALATRLRLPRHALHATSLAIPWHGGDRVWHSPLPADLAAFAAGHPVPEQTGIVIWNRNA
jgi:23S rRNA pseudouridine1911/1915/1917 synthase